MIMSILLALLLTLALLAEPRCPLPGSPTQELARVTAVFSGKVVGRDYVPEERAPGQIVQRLVVKIEVARVWKGDIYTQQTMRTAEVKLPRGFTEIFSEDFVFEDDKEYLIYALEKDDRLYTNGCTRSRELAKAGEDLRELGDGHEPKTRN
jgi:hypothetical protein